MFPPQFHVIYDDDFTTVPYLRTGTVPPHWADLVKKSSEINLTNDSTNSWDSLPTEAPEEGDFNSDNDRFASLSETQTADDSTDDRHAINSNNNHTVLRGSSDTQDGDEALISEANRQFDSNAASTSLLSALGFSNEDTTTPVHDCEGDIGNTVNRRVRFMDDLNFDADRSMEMPKAINLEQSGLRRSPRIRALNECKSNNGTQTNLAYTTQKTAKKHTYGLLQHVICSWNVHSFITCQHFVEVNPVMCGIKQISLVKCSRHLSQSKCSL